MTDPIYNVRAYGSYNQIVFYDLAFDAVCLVWDEQRSDQGFVRMASVLYLSILLDAGFVDLRVFLSKPDSWADYTRVTEIPFYTPTGVIRVESPAEYPIDRSFALEPGAYLLVFAQCEVPRGPDDLGLDRQLLDVFATRTSDLRAYSEILKADDQLSPKYPLLETAEVYPT